MDQLEIEERRSGARQHPSGQVKRDRISVNLRPSVCSASPSALYTQFKPAHQFRAHKGYYYASPALYAQRCALATPELAGKFSNSKKENQDSYQNYS
jgi:hypothetical protein